MEGVVEGRGLRGREADFSFLHSPPDATDV